MVYLLMAALGLTAVVLVARQERRPAELAAIFSAAAVGVMIADWVCFGWFALYTYQPHLVGDRQVDCSLGELLADIIFVPALATLVMARLPKLIGAVLGTFAVTATEFLFVRHGLLLHHGWETWYSALLFPLYFVLVGQLRQRLERLPRLKGSAHVIIRLCLLFAIIGVYTLGLRPFNLVNSNVHLFPERIQNQSLGRFLTYPTVFMPIGYWVMAGGPRKRRWRLGAALVLFGAVNLIFMATGFQLFRAPYRWYFDAIGQAVAAWVACICDDWLLHHWAPEPNRAV